MKRILIIEDDQNIAELEKDYLELNDYEAKWIADGREGLAEALTGHYDMVIVDLMLPSMDGFEIVKRVRQQLEIPIMIVSARTEDIDKIRGLGMGADDHLSKPFSPAELVARVKSHLLRYERLMGVTDKVKVLASGGLELNVSSREVFVNGKEVQLTTKEFDMLAFLMKHPNLVFSKSQLYEKIWHEDDLGEPATVAVHIQKIRKKIEADPSEPKYIETVWGAGYRLRK